MAKKTLRWLILGGTLFFIIKALKNNWQEVAAIHIDNIGWSILALATGITLMAHIWAGWVWTWVIKELCPSIYAAHFIQVYLKTNIAKYLPGNIWHYYGRIVGARSAGVSLSVATLSVLLEPLLMAAAALIIVILGSQFTRTDSSMILAAQVTGLLITLAAIHPQFLNRILHSLQKAKQKKAPQDSVSITPVNLKRYPFIPLLGEFGFLGLRSSGFLLTIFALQPLHWQQIPLIIAAFSFSWLLGLVVPGAPGGLGVFEATAIAMLQSHFSMAVIIGAIGMYRLVSTLAEIIAAILAWSDERLTN
ncbi:MAG: flippase-like domain-containing protein [Richelia sp.]|nr:flippase-like domain-containing protein [Richelia sp.]